MRLDFQSMLDLDSGGLHANARRGGEKLLEPVARVFEGGQVGGRAEAEAHGVGRRVSTDHEAMGLRDVDLVEQSRLDEILGAPGIGLRKPYMGATGMGSRRACGVVVGA